MEGREPPDLTSIPFENVSHEHCRDMAVHLQPAVGNDWRILAEKLGMPPQEARAISSTFRPDFDGLCALSVFHWYFSVHNNNVQEVKDTLEEMGRDDVLRILEKAIPEAVEKHLRPPRRLKKDVPEMIPTISSTSTQSREILYRLQSVGNDEGPLTSLDSLSTGNSGRMPTDEFENGPPYNMYSFTEENGIPLAMALTRTDYRLASVSNSFEDEVSSSFLDSRRKKPASQINRPCDQQMDTERPPKIPCPEPGIMGNTEARMRPEVGNNLHNGVYDCNTNPGQYLAARGLFDSFENDDVGGASRDVSVVDKHNLTSAWIKSLSPSECYPSYPDRSTSGEGQIGSLTGQLDEISLRHTFPKSVKKSNEEKDNKARRTVSATPDLQKSAHVEAERQQRVYITYCIEYKDKAIKLQSYLRQNGFRVALDDHDCLSDASLSQNFNHKSDRKQIRNRFKSADFVIVCVSPEYRSLWDKKQSLSITKWFSNRDSTKKEQLHRSVDVLCPSRVVYDLMEKEIQKNPDACKRYIVVRCNRASKSDIPPMLSRKCVVYKFPDQYKAFLTNLVKPRDIVDAFIQEEKSKQIATSDA